MDLNSLAKQDYLNACIEEGLRMFPPAPTAMPRRSPPGGGIVCGKLVPEGVSMAIIFTAVGLNELMNQNLDYRWCHILGCTPRGAQLGFP